MKLTLCFTQCYRILSLFSFIFFFFFNDTATTEIYTLSLHDALPIFHGGIYNPKGINIPEALSYLRTTRSFEGYENRSEGTRLNSSHSQISYAVFCLKKKKNKLIYK